MCLGWLVNHLLTIAYNVQDILHGEEVETGEDLTSALQVVQQRFSAFFKTAMHVLQDLKNICNDS